MNQSPETLKKIILGLSAVIIAVVFFLIGMFAGHMGSGPMMRGDFSREQMQDRGGMRQAMPQPPADTASGTPMMQAPTKGAPVPSAQ